MKKVIAVGFLLMSLLMMSDKEDTTKKYRFAGLGDKTYVRSSDNCK